MNLISWVAVLAVHLAAVAVAGPPAGTGFYCLERVVPVGQVLQNLTVPQQQRVTAGQTARWCNAQCAAHPGCTAAWSAGALAVPGPTCLLLHPGEESWQEAFAGKQTGNGYPHVQPQLDSRDGAKGPQARQLSWLCMRQHQWDEMGSAINIMYGDGRSGGSWCALGHDVAGSNVDRLTSLSHPHQCSASCDANPACTQWIFVQTLNRDFQPDGYDCWLKRSSFLGSQGWSAPYQDDGYAVPDSAVACFRRLGDWRAFGRLLTPDVATYAYKGLNYTIFPETVNFTEASAACAALLGNGSLAVLPTRDLLVKMDEHLLLTLPWKRSLKMAWVGFEGTNAAYGHVAAAMVAASGAADLDGLQANGSAELLQQLTDRTQASLHWLLPGGGSAPVNSTHLKVLRDDLIPWTMHSNLADQTYIPPTSHGVCGRLVNQLPPMEQAALPGDIEPGLWYFDCARRPAAFLCQSTAVPPDLLALDRVSAYQYAQENWDATMDTSSPGQPSWMLLVLPVVVCTACLTLLLLLLLSCAGSRHLNKLQFLLGHQHKRAMGKPANGQISVVVTDIEGYSHFANAHPDDMAQALQAHNHIIRHAAYVHAGFVTEQEGDSFVVAFHEPQDAVAFALQVQQALVEADVSSSISYSDGLERWHSRPPQSCSNQLMSQQHHGAAASAVVTSAVGLGVPAAAMRSAPVALNGSKCGISSICEELPHSCDGMQQTCKLGHLQQQQQQLEGSDMHQTNRGIDACGSHACTAHMAPTANTAASSLMYVGCFCSCSDLHQQQPQLHTSSCDLSPFAAPGSSACTFQSRPALAAPQAPAAAAAGAAQAASNAFRRRRSDPGGKCHWWQQLIRLGGGGQQLFRGLRVRMGISSGHVVKGQGIQCTAAYACAKAISETANGGQVLCDDSTFAAVRSELLRLGAVTSQGVDFSHLSSSRRRWLQSLCCKFSAPVATAAASQDALALDMGLFEVPLLLPTPSEQQAVLDMFQLQQQAAAGAASSGASGGGSPWDRTSWLQHQQHQDAAGLQSSFPSTIWRTVARLNRSGPLRPRGSMSSSSGSSLLRLYQLLPPCLAARAALFGSSLFLSEDWVQLEPGFFSAPGLSQLLQHVANEASTLQGGASGSASSSCSAGGQLPAVTSHDTIASRQHQHHSQAGESLVGAAGGRDSTGSSSRVKPETWGSFIRRQRAAQPQVCNATAHSAAAAAQPAAPAAMAVASSWESLAALRAASISCSLVAEPVWQLHGSTTTAAAAVAGSSGLLCSAVPAFPPVTFVFVFVEGSRRLQQKQLLTDIRPVHHLLHSLMLAALHQLDNGGYLVRAQPGDLRYMLAFATPSAALEWCLVVQEAALYLPYPKQLLQCKALRAEHDAAGRLVFRGPRLKMGLYEGSPQAIMPDAWGKADYFGACVNTAARFADAAAHGGQVVTDVALARRVLQLWQQKNSSCSGSNGDADAGDGDSCVASLQQQQQQPSASKLAAAPLATSLLQPGQSSSGKTAAAADTSAAAAAAAAVSLLVELHWLGTFMFKGSARSHEMVVVCPSCLAGRALPAAAPRGKGSRVAERQGLAERGVVALPAVVAGYSLFTL